MTRMTNINQIKITNQMGRANNKKGKQSLTIKSQNQLKTLKVLYQKKEIVFFHKMIQSLISLHIKSSMKTKKKDLKTRKNQ